MRSNKVINRVLQNIWRDGAIKQTTKSTKTKKNTTEINTTTSITITTTSTKEEEEKEEIKDKTKEVKNSKPKKVKSSKTKVDKQKADFSEVKVLITNTYSYVKTTNNEILEKLSKSLSFNQEKYMYGKYNKGKQAFFTKRGKFGTGLLPFVTEHLEKEFVEYTIQDDRQHLTQLFSSDPLTTGEECIQIDGNGELFADKGVTLRDYQVKAVNMALQKHRGVVKCATGGGKSWILAGIIKALGEGVPVVIMVRQKILVEQLHKTLTQAGIKDIGIVSGGVNNPSTVTICTIQSLNNMQDLLNKARVLMVDEVHDFTSDKSQLIMQGCSNAYMRLGFSATPFKGDIHKHTVMSCFGPPIVDISTTELIGKQVLAPSIAHIYPINYPKVFAESWPVAEREGIVESEYFNKVVSTLVNSIPSGRILVLVKRINHGDTLHRLIPNSVWISGRDDLESRQKVLEMLRTSTEQKVVALMSSVGFVGVDVFVHHVVNAAGGKEPYLTIQKIGRGLRKSGDKNKLDYHDFYFTYSMNRILAFHSKVRVKTLEEQGHTVIREPELPVEKPTTTIKFKQLLY